MSGTWQCPNTPDGHSGAATFNAPAPRLLMVTERHATRLNWAVLVALLIQFIVTTYRAGRLTRQVEDLETRVVAIHDTVRAELERHRMETEKGLDRVEGHIQRVEGLVIQHVTAPEQHKAGHGR